MKLVPKYPAVPELTSQQIRKITEIVFLPLEAPSPCDVIFVFGCPDPVIWDVVKEAYDSKLGKWIIVTGGYNPNPKLPQNGWNYGNIAESKVIVSNLISLGVPSDIIFFEDKSVDSWGNVLFAKEVFDFSKVESILFISKNIAAGRQSRILKKFLPNTKKIVPYTYDTKISEFDITINRDNWMNKPESLSFVFGSYLRIVQASKNNGIEPLESYVEGLDNYVKEFC